MTDPARETTPNLSVVVIGRNEGPRLRRCLDSIRSAHYPADRIELIYVDSGSTDDSLSVADQLGARTEPIVTGPFSAARARNVGLRAASHELLHFFDADTVVDTHWLRHAVDQMHAHPSVACVTGTVEEIDPHASIYMLVSSFDWHIPPGFWRMAGGNVLVRADIVRRCGGYDESLVAGEEADLCYRLRQDGWQILQTGQPMVRHDLAMRRFRQYWRRIVRTGLSYGMIALRFRRRPEKMWLRETLLNLTEVGLWIAIVACAIALRSPAVALVLPGLIVARILWIATRARLGRRAPLTHCLTYAAHCQFSRIPLSIGHLLALKHTWARTQPQLLEYKTP